MHDTAGLCQLGEASDAIGHDLGAVAQFNSSDNKSACITEAEKASTV
jgi:hypothetical protein